MQTGLFVSNIALWVVVIAQALFILALFRYVGLLIDRVPPEGIPLGQPAPRKEIQDLEGNRYVLGEKAPRSRVLIFLSRDCPWCEKLAPDIAPFAASLDSQYDVLVISTTELGKGDARAYADRLGAGPAVKVAVAPHLLEAYRISGTPYGITLDREGVVRSKGVTNTLTDLQTLIKAPVPEAAAV